MRVKNSLTPKETFASGQCLSINHAVVPEDGEDSFAFQTDATGGYLCVADGCGGLGSRRYADLGDRTGAFLASRLVTLEVEQRAITLFPLPDTPQEGQAQCQKLADAFAHQLRQFEAAHGMEQRVRIVGRMQRTLPSTLCLCLLSSDRKALDCMFLWAGDSRGYLLNAKGLHQMTSDHTAAQADAMESLYMDAPLCNMLHGEGGFYVSGRRARVKEPCIAVVATDGVYAYLQSPMELEWLLLSTLQHAKDMEGWQQKLGQELEQMASDDSTLQLAVYGYKSFESMQRNLAARRMTLQKHYIDPVRERQDNRAFTRAKWQEYMQQYDWTERTAQGEPDWRV